MSIDIQVTVTHAGASASSGTVTPILRFGGVLLLGGSSVLEGMNS